MSCFYLASFNLVSLHSSSRRIERLSLSCHDPLFLDDPACRPPEDLSCLGFCNLDAYASRGPLLRFRHRYRATCQACRCVPSCPSSRNPCLTISKLYFSLRPHAI